MQKEPPIIETELKPCPFCGGKARIITDGGGFRACCGKCFASTGLLVDEETAAAAWNKRLKHQHKCNDAERNHDGTCRGYQRAEWDDEPADMCKGCPSSEFFLGEHDE